MVGAAEADYIQEGIKYGVRRDGRAPKQFRELTVDMGVIQQASGSARCQLGGTIVLVGIKTDIGAPLPDRPDEGGLDVAIDLSPCAHQAWGRDLAHESQQMCLGLSKSLRRSLFWAGGASQGCAIDLGVLRIVSKKRCWVLTLDGLILSDDGNVLGALSIAMKAALVDLRIPRIEVTMAEADEDPELDLDDDPDNAAALDISRVPLLIPVSQFGDEDVLDLNHAEERACRGATLRVAIRPDGTFSGLDLGDGDAVRPDRLLAMVEAAQKTGVALHRAVDAHLQKAVQ